LSSTCTLIQQRRSASRWQRRSLPSCHVASPHVLRCCRAGAASDDLELKMQLEALKPAIILVEPKMGENIGAAARAMKNFGLSDLRLVKPHDGWPNPAAEAMASHAVDLLRSARVYDSVEAAIADLDRVYAATARTRFMAKAFVTSRQLPGDLHHLAATAVDSARATQAAVAMGGVVQAALLVHPPGALASPEPTAPPPGSTFPGMATSVSAAGSDLELLSPTSQAPSSPAAANCSPETRSPMPLLSDSKAPAMTTWLPPLSSLSSPPPPPSSSSSSLLPCKPSTSVEIRVPHAGVMFGREASGLTNEEVAAANKVLAIEAHPDYPVLNLAQAVVCVAYELHHARLEVAGTVTTVGANSSGPISRCADEDRASLAAADCGGLIAATAATVAVRSSADDLRARAEAVRLATRGDMDNFLRRLVSELDRVDFFESVAKRPATLLSIRNLAAKVEGLTASEVALLHGMLSKLTAVTRQRS
ncbi:hypothetical protein Vretifemale_4330, partial [Volvox reticuliferus]